jgi:hypothetical protein
VPKLSQRSGPILGGAILVLLLTGSLVTAQEQPYLRLSRNVPGEAHPITLYADTVTTWTESGQRIVLLKGKVFIEHNLINLRCQQAVIWLDETSFQKTHILHADVFGEGEVQLESGQDAKAGAKAMLDLNTRGVVRIKAQGGKVVQEAHPEDAFYRHAAAERTPQPPQPPPPPKPAAAQPPSGQQRTSFLQSVPGSGSNPVVRAQASEPAPAASGPVIPPIGVPPPPGARDPGGQPLPQEGSSGGPPPPPPATLPPRPAPLTPPAPAAPPRNITIGVAPRTPAPFQTQSFPMPNGEQAVVITGGVILTVRSSDAKTGLIDIEADQCVFWTRDNSNSLLNMQKDSGQSTREQEFYLAGNVEIRQLSTVEKRLLRADEVYYDVGRNVAVAISGDLEMNRNNVPYPIHFRSDELYQRGPALFEGKKSVIYASKLPSDPGIEIYVSDATVETQRRPRRTIFGIQFYDRKTGQPETEQEALFTGWNNFLEISGVPVFYFPYLHGNANDPLGPITNIGTGYSQIFGVQSWVTFDVYELIGVDPLPGTRWRYDIDYLSARGPGMGTNFDYAGKQLFNWGDNKYAGTVKAWGIIDHGNDNLGGGRGVNDDHPQDRGRFLWRDNWWELPGGFTIQGGVGIVSDMNFLEQYYKLEFDQAQNQETYLYVKQQQGTWAWSALVQPKTERWYTDTEWYPRVDGWLLGQSFFDRFTYNAHTSLAYARLRPTEQVEFPSSFPQTSTDSPINLGRFDLWQELSAPLAVGPVKVVPYGVLDLTEYTNYLQNSPTWPAPDTDTARGRFYGAGGVRTSLPFTRLFPEVQSELFNVNGINHKITLNTNYYAAYSDIPFYRLPQLDRLNDDATDQALRDITPIQPNINPPHGLALQTETLFNPQFYAIRRLLNNYSPDTLESIEEVQFDINQRWQTKRGYPGNQHIVDWMTLDLSATYFPHATRDNFGSSIGFVEYNWTWNIGDRTSLVSSGWYDPFDTGARVTTIGWFFERPDRTNFFIGYRELDPLQSRAVTASISYVFSPKYAITGSTVYDFGTSESLSNYLAVTRMGTDVQVSLGISYNAIQNNFGVVFQIIPNLVPQAARLGGLPLAGQQPGMPFSR